jgi:hypothetical protein
MTRYALRWLQRTLPPTYVTLAAIALFLSSEGLYFWMRYGFDSPDSPGALSHPWLVVRDQYVALVMGFFGVFRAIAFHPVFRLKYRAWLEQTPWCSRKMLPLGPIHLAWSDLAVLGVVTLALHGTAMERIWVLAAFFAAYVGVLGVSFWMTGPWWMGYAVVFGLGVTVRLATYPVSAVAAFTATYVVAMIGLHLALARFPWPESKLVKSLTPQLRPGSVTRREPMLGWPYAQLTTLPPDRRICRRDGILGPLLAAWWVFVIASIRPAPDVPSPGDWPLLPVTVACIASFLRLLIYVGPCIPSIGLRGRIATGHWIVPGYDYVFLAPLATLLVGLIGLAAAIRAGSEWSAISYPLAAAATSIVAFNMGPSLRKWQLTGHHRIVSWIANDAGRVRL